MKKNAAGNPLVSAPPHAPGRPPAGRGGTSPDTAAWSWRVTAYVLVSRVVAAGLRLILGRFVAGRYALVRGLVEADLAGGFPPVDEELLLALMCAEDHRFLHHAGVDVLAVARAAWRTAVHGRPEGASTVEQQCVRVLGRDYRRRLSRKLAEMAMACLLARDFDKPAIAAVYLRHAYFGSGMHGLDAALDRMGLAPGRLDPAQAAALAARLKYPQPFEPDAAYAARIAAREGHVGRLRDSYGPKLLAALRPKARTGRPPCPGPGPVRPAAPPVPGDLGHSPAEAAGGFVRQEAVDWALVRHFQPREWGGDPSLVDPDIVYRLDRARHLLGRPCMIHVAHAVTGHAPRSYHSLGRAVDFHFGPGASLAEELEALLAAGFTGIGCYPGWAPRPGWHADNRRRPMFWMRLHGVYRRFPSPQALLYAAADAWDAGRCRCGERIRMVGRGGCRTGADMFYEG